MVSIKKISRLLELAAPTVFPAFGTISEKYKLIVPPEYYGTIWLNDEPNKTHKMKDLKTLLEEENPTTG